MPTYIKMYIYVHLDFFLKRSKGLRTDITQYSICLVCESHSVLCHTFHVSYTHTQCHHCWILSFWAFVPWALHYQTEHRIFRHTLPGKHLQQWSSPKHLWCWAMTSFNTFLNSWRGGYALLTGAAGSIPRKRLELLIHNVRELTLFCLLWFLFVCFWATTGGGQSISWLCTQQSFSVDSGDHVKCLMTLEYLDEPQLAPSLL